MSDTDTDDDVAIGIDLGTTLSCVAVVEQGNVTIIHNEVGSRITPSWVWFDPEDNTKHIVGDYAKNNVIIDPTNTVYDAKRLIGRSFDDPNIQKRQATWPFTLVQYDDRLKVQIESQGKLIKYYPEEISAFVLQKMKTTAEEYLGRKVSEAVITVPAYFNNNQIQATKSAGTIAGLNVLQVLSEPTAAAVAYGISQANKANNKNILIYDLGGGTFDVSILRITEDDFKVLATAGNNDLGGGDFDQRMVEHFAAEFESKHGKSKKVPIRKNKKALEKLRNAVEKAKQTLSNVEFANVAIDKLHDGEDHISTITRARFEYMNIDLFEGTIPSIQTALDDAKLTKDQIDEVILVGGSTRIPKVQQLVREFFGGKQLNKQINPDEAVARGAALMASKLTSGDNVRGMNRQLQDVVPLSLGIATRGDVVNVLLPRNTKIPCRKTSVYSTSEHDQPGVTVEVFEGERQFTSGNILLGRFNLSGISKGPAGSIKIHVTLEMDEDRILHVHAEEKVAGKTGSLKIENEKGRLSKEEIDAIVQRAALYRREDERERKRISKLNDLEGMALELRRIAVEQKMLQKCEEVLHWLDDVKQLHGVDECVQKMKELKITCAAILH